MRPVIDASIGGVRLYDYQKDALKSLRAGLVESSAVVLQMPTGSGKTVAAAEFIRQEATKGPVWFVCHRREIIRQASRAFTQIGIRHGVIAPRPDKMGLGFAYDPDAKVKIASVQTLGRRFDKHEPPRLVVWDECHHVAAKTWANIREQLSGARHVGLTATPERLDGKGLSDWFSDLICGPSIKDLVEAGRLSRIRMFAPSEPDLTNARISMGDYRKEDADAAMNTPVLIGSAVEEYKRHVNGARAIAFATSVSASRNLAARFNEEGVQAAHIDATTPLDQRDEAISDLAEGRIKVLTNVEVFTEGVDVPAVDAIILFRPTRSLALYLQMVGRGMRIAEGKNGLTVLDHAGLVYEHGFPDVEWEWSLEGGARKRRVAKAREAGERMRKCPSCSHVHEPAPECPNCGHVYSGREIAECDGSLHELRVGPPEGYMSRRQFADMVNAAKQSVSNWMLEGMPSQNGFVETEAALKWMEENGRRSRSRPDDDGAVNQAEFANMVGVSRQTIASLVKKGMPASDNLWPIADKAKQWMRENFKSRMYPPFDVDDPESYVSPKEFEKTHGLSAGMAYHYRNMGLPCASNSWVNRELGAKWIEGNVPANQSDEDNFCVTKAQFAREFGVPVVRVHSWAKKGLPILETTRSKRRVILLHAREWVREHAAHEIPEKGCKYVTLRKFAEILDVHPSTLKNRHWADMPRGPNGTVPVAKAIEWVKAQNFPTIRPLNVSNPDHYERPGNFAVRIGVRDSYISPWRRKGMPCAGNGWPHIYRALCWVRDNTNHAIPPSAWEGVEPE